MPLNPIYVRGFYLGTGDQFNSRLSPDPSAYDRTLTHLRRVLTATAGGEPYWGFEGVQIIEWALPDGSIRERLYIHSVDELDRTISLGSIKTTHR